jgi:hypothetical protein
MFRIEGAPAHADTDGVEVFDATLTVEMDGPSAPESATVATVHVFTDVMTLGVEITEDEAWELIAYMTERLAEIATARREGVR